MNNKINVGLMLGANYEANFKLCAELGLDSFIMNAAYSTQKRDELISKAKEIKAMEAHYGIKISALWAGWDQPAVWSFYEGQDTLGLVPLAFRDRRIALIDNATKVAHALEIEDVITHAGYLPENPQDPLYTSFVSMMRYYCEYNFKPRGVYFDFETGQETPVTVRRAIEDIGTGNLGINLDTANLICYGKANPVDAVKVFGQYVRCTHMKDALWPTDGKTLGEEVKIGTGEVNFPEVIRLLNACGYKGHFTIEREIAQGDEFNRDVKESAEMLRREGAKYDWDFKEEKE